MAPVPSHSGRTGTERIDPCVDTGRRYHQAGQEGCLSTTALVVRRQGRWGPSQSRKKVLHHTERVGVSPGSWRHGDPHQPGPRALLLRRRMARRKQCLRPGMKREALIRV